MALQVRSNRCFVVQVTVPLLNLTLNLFLTLIHNPYPDFFCSVILQDFLCPRWVLVLEDRYLGQGRVWLGRRNEGIFCGRLLDLTVCLRMHPSVAMCSIARSWREPLMLLHRCVF